MVLQVDWVQVRGRSRVKGLRPRAARRRVAAFSCQRSFLRQNASTFEGAGITFCSVSNAFRNKGTDEQSEKTRKCRSPDAERG